MKLHVLHDQHGKIVAAAEVAPKGDKPIATPRLSVTELEVPPEFADRKYGEFMHLLSVDVGAHKLVHKRQ